MNQSKVETLTFSNFSLQLSFPLNRRLLNVTEKKNLRLLMDPKKENLVNYDEGELYSRTYTYLFEELKTAYADYFSTLVISLERVRDWQSVDIKTYHVLSGKVMFRSTLANNDNTKPTQVQVDDKIVRAFEGEKFLQLLQQSEDPVLASITRTSLAIIHPTGPHSSIYPDNPPPQETEGNRILYLLLILAIVICCILITLLLCILGRKFKKNILTTHDRNQIVDDGSTLSPGSNQKYCCSDDHKCSAHNVYRKSQSSLSSISPASTGTGCGRSSSEQHDRDRDEVEVSRLGKYKEDDSSIERKGEFEELWNRGNTPVENKVQTDHPCSLSFDTDVTPRSGNKSSI